MPSATYFLPNLKGKKLGTPRLKMRGVLVQKVGKNTLKEENPFDWVFSLKNLSFLNDQRG